MKKSTIIYLVAIICLASCGNKEEKKQTEAVRVVTETVTPGSAVGGRSYVGEVEAESSTAVSFTGSGTVEKVLVSAGQRVSKGQLIAVMDATQSKNAVMAAEAMMMQAEDAYKRMKVLHERNSLSDMDWVEVQSKRTQAESSLRTARKMLADCSLKAPCSGVIGSKMLEPGMVALPSQPVCNILDMSTVNVKISVPEREVGEISEAASSKIYVAALKRSFDGGRIVKEVEGDAISRTYTVKIRVGNADGALLPGMVCDVSVGSKGDAAAHSNAVFVPITAVQRSAGGEMYVWKASGGKAEKCPVVLGKALGSRIAVTQGLAVGDRIVVKGCQKLGEGSKIVEMK